MPMIATPLSLQNKISAPQVTVKALNQKHSEWKRLSERWKLITALVDGGDAVTDEVKKKLLANPDGRPDGVIRERVKVATYVNKIAPVVNRLTSQVFVKPGSYLGSKDPFWENVFFKEGGRVPGDDDNRVSFHSFLRDCLFSALCCGKVFAQVDTKISSGAQNLYEQKRNGALDPYVVLVPALDVWDWKGGSEGDGFNFVKIHKFSVVQDTWLSEKQGEHDFTIYERENGKVYISRYKVRKRRPDGDAEFPLTEKEENYVIITELEKELVFEHEGKQAFPVVSLTLRKLLVLASQLLDPAIGYFNCTAGINWKLQTSNFAMPILSGGDIDENPFEKAKWGDGYWLHLPQGWSISTYEGGGGSVSTAMSYRREINADFREILYQIAAAAEDGAAIIARSAQSKREDRRPEQILLETYGAEVKTFARQILNCAAIAHKERVDWQVEGFDDFLGEGLDEVIADLEGMGRIAIPSVRFKREVAKVAANRFSRAYGVKSDKATEIQEELEKAPESKFEPAGGVPDESNGNAAQNGGDSQTSPPDVPAGNQGRAKENGG